jgi:upstream activation factor subunit UAF30
MPTRKTAGGQAAASGKAAAPKAKSGKGAASGEAAAPGAGGKKPNALQQPLRPSKELAAVVGAEPLPRGAVVSKVWDYIKKHQLQNPEDRREILADAKLEAVFGQKKVTMFELNKHLAQHLK